MCRAGRISRLCLEGQGSARLAPVTSTVVSAMAARPLCRAFVMFDVEVNMVASPLLFGFLFGVDGSQLAPASAGCGSLTVVLATASESSSWWTSAKIAGTAVRPIAPSTRNAAWKPPVSAVGAAWPA